MMLERIVITCIMLILVHGFRQAVYDVVEEDRLFTDFDLNVKGMTAFAGVLIEGDIDAVADGTASESCDNYPYK